MRLVIPHTRMRAVWDKRGQIFQNDRDRSRGRSCTLGLMALIDVVKCDVSDQLVWKFPNSELSTLTQVIVNESQTAVLFKDGQRLDALGAGRHTLSTNNIPLLNRLVNLPFGGKSPFAAEVWFVNRAIPLDLKWGTPNPMQLEDPQYGLIVPVSAFGQMGIRISDPGLFLGRLVGVMPTFDTRTVLEYFKGVLVTQLKSSIAQAIVRRQVPILQIETELLTLSEDLQRDLQPHYQQFGLEVHLFRIMSISVPETDPGVQELKKAKATVARRKIEGISYAQERTFDVLQTGAGNEGMGGAFAAAGVGLAAGQSLGALAGQHLTGGHRAAGSGSTAAGIHPDLTRLIEAVAADGVFTDREREVLRRKAAEVGADPDEIEILADARAHAAAPQRAGPAPGAAPPLTGFGATSPAFTYHVVFGGQTVGPVSFDEMKRAAAGGQLKADTPVWRAGLQGWAPASDVPEIAQLLAPAGPPPFGAPASPPPFGVR